MAIEAKIGLETHVELLTKTKIFCSCKNTFGERENTVCCEICTGQPGAMPALNGEAVRLAVIAGKSLGCEVEEHAYMARKNYSYPDLPKAYQITQVSRPICKNGEMVLPSGRKIRIERLHIEEDAGKLKHKKGELFIDYNRAGVPLIEIVTKPDFKSGDEVKEYLELLSITMKRLDVSDCKMQEGSLRCDVNISLCDGDKCFERTEIKNVNSFAYAKKAIDYEIERQKRIIDCGKLPERETRRFDSEKEVTVLMRKKEQGSDYRYMDDPDILPVRLPEQFVREGEAAAVRPAYMMVSEYMGMGLSYEEAFGIAKYRGVADYFDEVCRKTGDSRFAAKLVFSYIFAAYGENERDEKIYPEAKEAVKAYEMIKSGEIASMFSKKLFSEMYSKRKSFSALFADAGFSAADDEKIKKAAKAAIEQNKEAAEDYKKGTDKAIAPLIGSVMKACRGKADAKRVREILDELIKSI